MEIRQLKHFVAVVDIRSMKRASDLLHVSQQGLSKSIHALEASVGAKLLERGRFGVRPTPHGKALLARARVICGYAQLAREDMQALNAGEAGTVSIGVGPYFEGRVIGDAILHLTRARPRISIRVLLGGTNDLINQLHSGEIDLSISTPSDRFRFPSNIETHVIFREKEEAMMRSGHPLARRQSCTLRELAKFPWVMSAHAATERERISTLIRQHSHDWPPRIIYADSLSTIVDLLGRENFVHISAPAMLASATSNPGLVGVPVAEIADYRVGVLASRKGDLMMPATRLARQAILDICKPLRERDRRPQRKSTKAADPD